MDFAEIWDQINDNICDVWCISKLLKNINLGLKHKQYDLIEQLVKEFIQANIINYEIKTID